MPLCPQITNTPITVSQNYAITAVSFNGSTATYTATGNDFTAGNSVVITGLVPLTFNGTFTISSVGGGAFTVPNVQQFAVSGVSFTPSTATYTASGNNYVLGQSVTVSGLAPAGYNGTFTITAVVAGSTFTVSNGTNLTVTDQNGSVIAANVTDQSGAATTFTVSDIVPVLAADTEQLAAVKLTADNAFTDAAAAKIAADAAAAKAATAVQTSANTIVNASNQLTAINGTGITVFSGASATSGARVVLNSAGLAGFPAVGPASFAIESSTGNVSITGGILAGGSITGTTINVPSVGSPAFSVNALGAVRASNLTLDGGQIFLNGGVFSVSSLGVVSATSGTIGGSTLGASSLTGGTIQTSTGNQAIILNGSSNALQFKSGGSVVANIVPLISGGSTFGLLLHNGATPDPSGSLINPQVFIGASNVSMSASSSVSFGVSTISGITATGNLDVSGAAAFATAGGSSAEFRVLTTGLVRSLFTYNRQVSTSTRAVLQDNAGNFGNSTSTRRNKHQIESYKIDSNSLLQLDVKKFKYNLNLDSDQTDQYGFIAEEAQELGLNELIQLDAQGIPDYFAYDKLPIFLLQLIQELKAEIDQLKGA